MNSTRLHQLWDLILQHLNRKITNHYLSRDFLKTWALLLLCFVILYTAVDFLEKINSFIEAGLGPAITILFFVAQLPKVVVLMTPVAVLISTIVTLTVLARNSEIVAFKAGGVSLLHLAAPLALASLSLSLTMFALSEIVVPGATAIANEIWKGQVRGQQNTSTVVKDVWIKGVNLVQHLGTYDESDGSVTDLSLFFTGTDLPLSRRLEARQGRFADGSLYLSEIIDKTYIRENQRAFTLQRHPHLVLKGWPAPPQGFGRTDQVSEEMSLAELWRNINRLTDEGFGPVRQQVDLQFRVSFALLPFIMMLVGLPLGFWKEKGGSIAMGVCLGLALSFIYLVAMELSRSLGYSGLLPPFVVAWLPNLIYTLFATYLFSYIRQ